MHKSSLNILYVYIFFINWVFLFMGKTKLRNWVWFQAMVVALYFYSQQVNDQKLMIWIKEYNVFSFMREAQY